MIRPTAALTAALALAAPAYAQSPPPQPPATVPTPADTPPSEPSGTRGPANTRSAAGGESIGVREAQRRDVAVVAQFPVAVDCQTQGKAARPKACFKPIFVVWGGGGCWRTDVCFSERQQL